MKKTVICLLFLFIFCAFCLAEERTYVEEEIIHIAKDGTITKEKPFRIISFNIIKDKIYCSGKIVRDAFTFRKGETFRLENPYLVVSKGMAMSRSSVFWTELFSSKSKIPQEIISAIRKQKGIIDAAEMLIVGKNFYMMTQPYKNLDTMIVSRGVRLK